MLRRVTILCRATAIGGAATALSLASALSAHAAGAPRPVRGLDVSAYQHAGDPINWGLLAKAGLRFAAIKVSEGTYYVNRYYRQDARAAAKSGLAVLPYVFANPRRAAGPATARFAVHAMGKQRGRLPLVIDLENDPYKKTDDCYGKNVPAMTAWITAFTREIETLGGRPPIIYTTAAWWQECTGNTARFRQSPLWLAAFNARSPAVPSPWQQWTFWQYSDNGKVPGIRQADLDFYRPTRALPTLRPKPKLVKKKPHPQPKPRHPKPKHPKPKHPKPKHSSKHS